MPNRVFTAVINRTGNMYVAKCPEIGTVSQGNSIDEALSNLKEATGIYLEVFPLETEIEPPVFKTFEVRINRGMLA